MEEKKYAIKKKDGKWLVTPNYHNNGFVICLYSKEEAKKMIDYTYNARGFKIGKIIT